MQQLEAKVRAGLNEPLSSTENITQRRLHNQRTSNCIHKLQLYTVLHPHPTNYLIRYKPLHQQPGDSPVCRLQILYPSLVLCSAGNDYHATAGKLSRRQPLRKSARTGADGPALQRVTSDCLLTQAHFSRVLEANLKAVERRNMLNVLGLGWILLCFGITDAQVSQKKELVTIQTAVRKRCFPTRKTLIL